MEPTTPTSPSRLSSPIAPVAFPPASELDVLFPGPDGGEGRSLKTAPRDGKDGKMLLELADGSSYEGYGFGQDCSISGECVFQTGQSRVPRRAGRADASQVWWATLSRSRTRPTPGRFSS